MTFRKLTTGGKGTKEKSRFLSSADEARNKRHMPTGDAAAQQQQEEGVLRVGDFVERDIDGIWFPAKVTAPGCRYHILRSTTLYLYMLCVGAYVYVLRSCTPSIQYPLPVLYGMATHTLPVLYGVAIVHKTHHGVFQLDYSPHR